MDWTDETDGGTHELKGDGEREERLRCLSKRKTKGKRERKRGRELTGDEDIKYIEFIK